MPGVFFKIGVSISIKLFLEKKERIAKIKSDLKLSISGDKCLKSMNQNQKFQYFHLEQKFEFLEIHCLFTELNPSISEEARAFFTMLYLLVKTDIKVFLDTLDFIDQNFLLLLTNLGRELFEKKQKLILKTPPIYARRYMERFDIDKILVIED